MSILINGIGVSRGIAVGEAYVFAREQSEILEYNISDDSKQYEIKRFKKAIEEAREQLHEIRQKIIDDTPTDIVSFIDTHILMIEDPAFNDATIDNINKYACNAEWALQKQSERLIQVFDEMEDPYLRTRKDDVLHVANRIQNCLAGSVEEQIDTNQLKGRIIIADDLTPADTLLMRHQKIAALVTEFGGPLSHTAILARNLGIPAIVGAHYARQLIRPGETLVVDGENGSIINDPDHQTIRYFKKLKREETQRRTLLKKLKGKPPVTLEGTHITLHGNIDRPEDISALKQVDDTGVGLYRTEMLFIEKNEWPDEETQYRFYKRALFRCKGKPITIRTSDLGADKEIQETLNQGPMAHNPAMGLRAIRRCLKEPDLFIPQLRAILRVSAYGTVRIMIPMLTNMTELKQVLALIEETKDSLRAENIPFDEDINIGAMIEVPAAALAAHAFASELDFLSVGTNDLIQYTLAIDRVDDEINHLYTPLHPSVLFLIQHTISAGKKAGIPVSICGEMASDPRYTRLLLGMGLTYFSVQANALLEIKDIINNSKIKNLKPRVKKILELTDNSEIEARVHQLNQ